MIEHREVREALELAAVEPGGLDRLDAGDTAEAVAIAGHLAGCPSCLEELGRLRRADAILRPILAAEPDPALRERTLALVRAVGAPRGGAEPRGDVAAPGAPAAGSPERSAVRPSGAVPRGRRPGRPRTPAWIGALAAVLVIGLVGGALIAGGSRLGPGADPAAALDRIARETAALLAVGDARQVVLRDPAGRTAGTLVLSPSAGRIVVTATGLDAPASGTEYRCWVEVGGSRSILGTMWWAGGVAWWTGAVVIPANLPAGVVYGVSLAAAGSSAPGSVVLTGGL